MNSSNICLVCRRTLSRKRPQIVAQWRPRATFISLSSSPPTTTDDKSRDNLLHLGDVEDGKEKRYIGGGAIPERRNQSPRHRTPWDNGDQLEALFEESLKQPPPEANERPKSTTLMESYVYADLLRNMLADEQCSVGDSWRFYEEHFGPEAWKKGSNDRRTFPTYLHTTKVHLARSIVSAKRRDLFSADLPTVTEFLKVYSHSGMLPCREWAHIMFVLLEGLIKLDGFSPKGSIHKELLVSDIVGAWNVVFRQVGKADDYPSEGTSHDWSHIPTLPSHIAIQSYRKFGTQGLFGRFFPLAPFQSQHHVDVIAVTTFALLTEESVADKAVVREAWPLVSSLGTAISIPGLDLEKLAGQAEVPSSINDFLKVSAVEAKRMALSIQNELREERAEAPALSELRSLPRFKSMPDGSLSSTIRTDISSITKRLYDAMIRRDAPQVDKLWSDALRFPVAKDPTLMTGADGSESMGRRKRGYLTADQCNYFIMIYMALRRPSRAIEVWNHMVKSGLTPSLKTWDSMLSGCKACKDHKALEDVWMKMLHLGVEPDVVLWTTRVSGLIECNKADKAMLALDEMGRLWAEANKKKLHDTKKEGNKMNVSVVQSAVTAVKPTIETINAAVAGLLRKRHPEAAHRVLAWAAKFDIKPNVITYNTLLTPLIRDGHTKEAMGLLKQMQEQGIQADVATFTTILDETFRYSDQLTPQEQKEITDNVLAEMETAGIKANLYTYGKMIYQLLQSVTGDLAAVNAVMEHMASHGVQPTTYIYTMLVNHYFVQEPPELDAVRNLIERARMEVGSVDHIFWDRVIEGYARAGDTASAMRVLGKLESRGTQASWVARQVLLTALVQNDEWTLAKTFVANVKADTGGPLPDHEMKKGQVGQQRFWRLATESELL